MAMMNGMDYGMANMASVGGFRAAIYCRLSKDDDLQGESASIANQRDMLENTANGRAGKSQRSIRTTGTQA